MQILSSIALLNICGWHLLYELFDKSTKYFVCRKTCVPTLSRECIFYKYAPFISILFTYLVLKLLGISQHKLIVNRKDFASLLPFYFSDLDMSVINYQYLQSKIESNSGHKNWSKDK